MRQCVRVADIQHLMSINYVVDGLRVLMLVPARVGSAVVGRCHGQQRELAHSKHRCHTQPCSRLYRYRGR
jgi:hypothetical protein